MIKWARTHTPLIQHIPNALMSKVWVEIRKSQRFQPCSFCLKWYISQKDLHLKDIATHIDITKSTIIHMKIPCMCVKSESKERQVSGIHLSGSIPRLSNFLPLQDGTWFTHFYEESSSSYFHNFLMFLILSCLCINFYVPRERSFISSQ